MPIAQKPPGEKPGFKEINAWPWEKLRDRFREHPVDGAYTKFGINRIAVEEFGRRILEFKNSDEKIIINDVGLGIEERKGVILRGRDLTKRNVSFEPFELLNQVRLAGIEPDRFRLYGIDERRDVLLAVRSTKVLLVGKEERDERYFQKFFQGFHMGDKGGYVPVRIPRDYRRRITCAELDIEKTPAPKKAHITFSYMYVGAPVSIRCLENLAKSTMRGGYVMTYCPVYPEILEALGLEDMGPAGGRVEKSEKLTKILLPGGSRLGVGNLYQGVYRVK